MTTTELILSLVTGIFASTGFWTFILYKVQKKDQKKDNLTKMILGLGHEKIIERCTVFIEKGSVTKDEYEDLTKYLYKPYIELGGNGTVERMMEEVKKLPIH